ncbi:MAG: SusD/RagB family nutrient-binding outer membrane lipoprotein, partial [Bacteroidota bacterium]
SRITDLWGDVPYFEALRGVNPDGDPILTPVYDGQDVIYADLLDELKDAASALDLDAGIFGGADPFYSGDVTRWRKFANTLRLRLALRVSNADPALAQQHATEVLAEADFISDNSEGAHFTFISDNESPFYQLDATGQGMRNPSHFLIEHLNATADPRLNILAEPTTESVLLPPLDYAGVPNLQTTADLAGFSTFNTSPVGDYFLQQSTPGTTLSFAESCFLQAEAAHKGWGGTQSAQAWYEAGVRAHMEYLNVATQDIDDFLAGGGAFDGTLEQIITQKWLTFVYRDGFEAYAEYRRTGFPALTDVNGAAIDAAAFPNRLAYPPVEISLNGTNVSAVGVGINDFSSKVWWAQ